MKSDVIWFRLTILDQPGLVKNTEYQRYSYRVNTDLNIGKMLKVSSDVTYRHVDRLWPESLGSVQYDVWSMQPTSPVRYENGDYRLDKQNRNAISLMDLDVVGEDRYNMDVVYGQVKPISNRSRIWCLRVWLL